MFLFGIIAGWSNENSVCCIILALFVFIYTKNNREKDHIERWMITGLIGMIIGYSLLIFSPGNFVRLSVQTEAHPWLTWETITEHAALMFLIFCLFSYLALELYFTFFICFTRKR